MFYSKARHYLFSVVISIFRFVSAHPETEKNCSWILLQKKNMSGTMNGCIIKSISHECSRINSFDLWVDDVDNKNEVENYETEWKEARRTWWTLNYVLSSWGALSNRWKIVENRAIKFLNEQYITANRKTGNVTQFYGMIL